MKWAPLMLVVVCAVGFTSAGVLNNSTENSNQTTTLFKRVTQSLPSLPNLPSAKGMIQRIQETLNRREFRIPILGRRNNETKSGNTTTASTASSTVATVTEVVTKEEVKDNVPASVDIPVKGQSHDSESCGGNILLDLKSRKDQTFSSTSFPKSHSKPYACSWDIKVAKNCRRGRVTVTVNPKSRLAREDQCSKGYFRISPFMKEAKICGSIASVPPFSWMVDQLYNPEDVTVIMKSIGLNDGQPEGLSFTVSGECLNPTEKSDITVTNIELSSQWMSRVSKLPSDVTLFTKMSIEPTSKLSANAADKISLDADADADAPESSDKTSSSITSADSPSNSKPKITYVTPFFALLRRFHMI